MINQSPELNDVPCLVSLLSTYEGLENEEDDLNLESSEVDDENIEDEEDVDNSSEDEETITEERQRVTDSINAVSTHLHVIRKRREKKLEDNPYEGKSNEDLLDIFHNMSDEEKLSPEGQRLKEEIFYKAFFLVPRVMKANYHVPSSLINDTAQNMSIAVLRTIDNYNPSFGIPLKGYITKYLKSAASQTFRESGVVTLPPGRKKSKRYNAACPPNEITFMSGLEYSPNIHGDLDSPDFCELIHLRELREILIDAISPEAGVLNADEREVVILRYGLMGMERLPYQDISKIRKAQQKGETCSRISQIHTSALKKLRAYFRECGIDLD